MYRRSQIVSFAVLLSIVFGSFAPFVPRAAAQVATEEPQATPTEQQRPDADIKDSAREQIDSLLREKESRNAAQRKIDSQLLYAIKEKRGQRVSDQVANVATDVEIKESGLTLVDISGKVTPALLARITRLGGEVVFSSESENSIRALVPFGQIERLARSSAVRFIEPAAEATTNRWRGGMIPNEGGGDTAPPATGAPSSPKTPPVDRAPKPQARAGAGALSPDIAARFARVKEQLMKSGKLAPTAAAVQQQTQGITGAVVSQGDETHQARLARDVFSVTGSGVKIGVLSDGVDALPALQAAGELPNDVTVLPGQAGSGSEGTAMLEIIHDLAPGAQLYFATAFISAASFANNIRALRAAGCDIIVDDIFYFRESPFQDDVIARAVNDVTANGALYFSSAGNAGNVTDNTSGVWEGDFADGGPTSGFTNPAGVPVINAPGQLHDFDPGPGFVIQNPVFRTSASTLPANLFWADPLGGSTNDYDLFLINETGTAVVASSTNVQSGTQDPFEQLAVPPAPAPSGRRIVVVKKPSAAPRYLHVTLNRNRFAASTPNAVIPAFNTPGQTKGHNSAEAAYGVAATPSGPVRFNATDPDGPFPNPFNPANVSETFTSDGTRRVFFNPDGTPITPGNFSSTGGVVRQKPDITAADGVSTATPGFPVFFGTSAAAPHAAAIAGLMLSGNSALAPDQVRAILTNTAIDIETPGFDRDTGAGIVMSFLALVAAGAQPSPALLSRAAAPAVTPSGGNGDQFIEPGESGSVNLSLINRGGRTATNVQATLTTTTPGVTITQGAATFPDIAKFATASNSAPFSFTLADDAVCGLNIEFSLTVTYEGGVIEATGENLSPLPIDFSVQTGVPGTTPETTTYNGPPVPIPDNSDTDPAIVPLEVSGFTGNLSDINFRFGGSACTSAAGATTVGLDHTFVGDLSGVLVSPQGTLVLLFDGPGLSSGNNFCNTVLDDGAASSIQNITAAGAPYTGTFAPATPLSAFNGEDPNGTWFLFVFDLAAIDTGSVRNFSLDITPYECAGGAPATSRTQTFGSGAVSDKVRSLRSASSSAELKLRGVRPSMSLQRRTGTVKEEGQGDQAP